MRATRRSRTTWRRLGAMVAVAIALAGCGGATSTASPEATASIAPPLTSASTGATSASAGPVQLTVLGASSLTAVVTDLADAYQAAHPGVSFALSFDASSALRARIEAGGGADAFLSADTSNPDTLVSEGLARGKPVVFARNELALVVPATNPAHITSPYDLARPGVRIVAAAASVPIAKYTAELIQNLQRYRGAQAGLPDAIAANTVSHEDNVKAVLAKVELGEADAGIVYATDAKGDANVTTIPLPPGTNVTASYAAAALSGSSQPAAADAFVAWLTDPAAQAILVRYGFLPPS